MTLLVGIGLLAAVQATPSPHTAPDSLVSFDGRRTAVERTTLTVGGAHGNDSVAFAVTFLRLPTTAETPGDPIVFLMGGPGVPASVIARVPPYFTLFNRLRDVADVILLDQRGTGLSRPTLDCAPTAPPETDFLVSTRHLTDALVATHRPCIAGWRGRGVPAELIGVQHIARDIEVVRLTIGATQVSLLGFSFGSRIALQYARDYPDRVARVALQGVLGFEHGMRLPTTLDSLLDRIGVLTDNDPVARGLTPNLRTAFVDRLDEIAGRPLAVAVTGSGDTVELTVGSDGLRALLTSRLTDPRLPALLATLERGDTRILGAWVGGIYHDLTNGGGPMFGRAAYCSAPPSHERERFALRLAAASVVGEVFDNVPASPAFCEALGIRPGPRTDNPSRLGGRALLIEGSLDDRTPLGNAAEMASLFSEAAVVTVINGGHELLPSAEIQALVVEFFATGRVGDATLTWPPPAFMTIEQALAPPRRPGQ